MRVPGLWGLDAVAVVGSTPLTISRMGIVMRVSWGRGFLRAWGVLAVLWISLFGWHEYTAHGWVADPFSRGQGDCWDGLAKWPDGQPFSEWDAVGDEMDVASNVEINKKNHAWAADSIAERNRWRHTIRQKVNDCEAAKPIIERLILRAIDYWSALKGSLPVILLPPIVLLIAGWTLGWIIKGFRPASVPTSNKNQGGAKT